MSRRIDSKIWSIAWPAIVANISIPALGLVDAALLGHLDSPLHLGAVALGNAVLAFLYWGFGFLRMGTTGEVARAMGAGDATLALLAFGRASVLALVIATLLFLTQHYLLGIGMTLMDPQPEVRATALNYASLRLYSAPATLLTYTAVGWFIGRQNTRWPMLIAITTNLTNIGLDALFILGLGWASTGAALATVCAEYLGLTLALLAMRRHLQAGVNATFLRGLRDFSAYRKVVSANFQLFLRTFLLLFAFAFFAASGEKLGPDVLAANAIMIQFLLFAAFAMDGFAYAAEGLAGEALGANDVPRFYAVTRRCALWTGVSALLISALILVGQRWLFPALTGIPAVLEIMREQGLWLVLLPLVAAPSYLLDGVFIGAGATRSMMISMLLSTVLVYLPVWQLTTGLGNTGLWLAFTAFNGARGLTLAWSFYSFSRHRRWSLARRDREA